MFLSYFQFLRYTPAPTLNYSISQLRLRFYLVCTAHNELLSRLSQAISQSRVTRVRQVRSKPSQDRAGVRPRGHRVRAHEPSRHRTELGVRLVQPRRQRPREVQHLEGKIHRVDPAFGSTLTVSSRYSQSKCWINWKIMGQPCEFQV